jgi:beta-N-acetylglucosaminidase
MFDFHMLALASFTLNQYLFMLLRQKGVLTETEAKELLEQALLNLETHQAQFPQAAQQYEGARALLESLRLAAFGGKSNPPRTAP